MTLHDLRCIPYSCRDISSVSQPNNSYHSNSAHACPPLPACCAVPPQPSARVRRQRMRVPFAGEPPCGGAPAVLLPSVSRAEKSARESTSYHMHLTLNPPGPSCSWRRSAHAQRRPQKVALLSTALPLPPRRLQHVLEHAQQQQQCAAPTARSRGPSRATPTCARPVLGGGAAARPHRMQVRGQRRGALRSGAIRERDRASERE